MIKAGEDSRLVDHTTEGGIGLAVHTAMADRIIEEGTSHTAVAAILAASTAADTTASLADRIAMVDTSHIAVAIRTTASLAGHTVKVGTNHTAISLDITAVRTGVAVIK